jgi:mycothiol synthase
MSELPQLRMRHDLRTLPEARPLPEGAIVRRADLGDIVGLGKVLSESFGEAWDEQRVRGELLDSAGVPETFVVELAGEIVATASYQVQTSPDPDAGWVHWVGVSPAARGLGLGEIVSRRVLEEAVERGRSQAFLATDDPRIAAIRTYDRLGFVPDMWHSSHEERWAKIWASMG